MKLRTTENKCLTSEKYFKQLQKQPITLHHPYLDEKKTMVSKSRLIKAGVRVSGQELVYGASSLITGELLQVQSIFKDRNSGEFVKLLRGSANGEPLIHPLSQTSLSKAVKIVLAESLSKACAIADAIQHEEEEYAVLNCLNSGNLVKVAENLGAMPFYSGKVIIAADNDLDNMGKPKNDNVTSDGYLKPVLECAINYNIPIVKPINGFKDYDDWAGASVFAPSEIWECIKNTQPYEGKATKEDGLKGTISKHLNKLYGELVNQFDRMANKFGLVSGSGNWDKEYSWLSKDGFLLIP